MSPCFRTTGGWEGADSKEWLYPTLILCVFGFFIMMRPTDSFVVACLVGPDKNIPAQQVMNEILPVWTYSCLVMLIPIFLLTDYLKHKPVVVLHGFSFIIQGIILIFGQGVLMMKFMFFVYGMAAATKVACNSYIYSVVSSEHYQKVTGYSQSANLFGHAFGSTLGQVLISVGNASYLCLNVISLASVSVAFLISILLPMPKGSMIFHREEVTENSQVPSETEDHRPKCGMVSSEDNPDTTTTRSPVMLDGEVPNRIGGGLVKMTDHNNTSYVFRQLWLDFKECYSSPRLLSWCTCWALSSAGFQQVMSYVQVLWDHIEPTRNVTVYNGGAETVSNLVGATCSFAIGHMKLDWEVWGELALGTLSVVNSGVLYVMALTNGIWVSYTCYTILKSSYMVLITIAMFQIAVNLKGHYALVFGINTMVTLTLQTLLTVIVVDSRGLGLDIITQVLIYATYFAAVAGLFLVRGVYTFVQTGRRRKRQMCSGIIEGTSLSTSDVTISAQL
ncbi:thiamine transporter 2-like isoform X2 [Hypanus sabinus]|uniref:thiamine transporter 2-like isoform X2 n=1 Tax=Hypanus sabinus TaxID=79690 RepID=UPI0028C3DE96|nr:thiamine transporter 2-like isoform X2 [Hypanus sabinus]